MDARVERSRRLVREAALVELVESGYGGFAIDAVAARAGVGRSTVYRHWSSKLDLIADALETLNEQPAPEPGQGTARDRVERLLSHLAEALTLAPAGRTMPTLIDAAQRDPTVRAFLHRYSAQRRRALVVAIADGVAGGEFRAQVDPELAAAALSGAVFYRCLMTDDPLAPGQVPALIDAVLATRLPA